MTMKWQVGRELAGITLDDNTSISYAYNTDGMRTCKNVGGTKTYYYYDDSNNLVGLTQGSTTMFFYYDSDNSPVSMSYNGTMYYYVKNLQGDIVKIINKSGTVYGIYTYDAWGNVKKTYGDPFVSELNSLRYRGYVYDTDTGLYYLQSRYYDSVTGRFLNADDTAYIGASGTVLSGNIFAYCENNPVINSDPFGMWKISLSVLKKIFIIMGLNPIASVLIGIGIYKLKVFAIAKFTLFISKLGTFFGPIVKVALTALAAITGIFILGPIVGVFFDAVLQRKKGIEIKLKKTWFGLPYGISVNTY